MFDEGDATWRRVLTQLQKRGTWLRLVSMARWSTREWSRAEDLVQETLMRVGNPADLPWDGKRPFLSFMSFMFRHVFCDWMRRLCSHELPTDATKMGRKVRDSGPSPDEDLDERRTAHVIASLKRR
ncbi:MAG: RNA polymerase sigma factor, partial [Polyangiaceae bacterium]